MNYLSIENFRCLILLRPNLCYKTNFFQGRARIRFLAEAFNPEN